MTRSKPVSKSEYGLLVVQGYKESLDDSIESLNKAELEYANKTNSAFDVSVSTREKGRLEGIQHAKRIIQQCFNLTDDQMWPVFTLETGKAADVRTEENQPTKDS